jgi:hypothetical protein
MDATLCSGLGKGYAVVFMEEGAGESILTALLDLRNDNANEQI